VSTPAPSGTSGRFAGLAKAARQLRGKAEEDQDVLATLPCKAARSPSEQLIAERVQAQARRARAAFMQAYAEEVYAELTDGSRRQVHPSDLLYGAAAAYPGLVPDRDLIAAERERIQSAKEGHERDQGIFLAGLLRSPAAGRHLIAAARVPSARANRLIGAFRSSGHVELGTVSLVRAAGIGWVTVHNTRYLNAEDDKLGADLETAVDLVLLDDAIGVGVLRGGEMNHPRYAGRRVFSSGMNLTHLYHGQISFADFVFGREVGYLAKIFRGHHSADDRPAAEKPWLAAVDTFAIGGGMQLLLVFDLVVAENEAFFGLPAAQEGIVPGAANLRLPRLAGLGLARQLIVSGRRLRASEPEARLICDAVVPADAMDDEIRAAAERLAEPGVIPNRHMLHVAAEPPDVFREYLAEFAVLQAERMYSADVISRLEQEWIKRGPRG
jgi:thioesterase DpgC